MRRYGSLININPSEFLRLPETAAIPTCNTEVVLYTYIRSVTAGGKFYLTRPKVLQDISSSLQKE